MTRLTHQELERSTLANRNRMPNVIANIGSPGFSLVSLVKVQTDSGVAQAWRVTLGRLDRADNTAVAHPGDPGDSAPIYIGQQYEYRAWIQNVPIVPPRRASPIFDALDPGNGTIPNDEFVEIAWGMENAQPNRLLAHWPAQGGSIVLVGSYVEVWGAGRVPGLGVPPAPGGSFPLFQATITEDTGLETAEGAELSLTMSGVPQQTAVVGFLFPDGVAHPAPAGTPTLSDGRPGFGLTVRNPATGAAFSPVGALRGSAVLSTAPFAGWNPTIRPFISGRTPVITMWVQGSGLFPNVTVFNNSRIDTTGTVTPSNGNVAIRIDTAAAPQLTFALLEAAIAAAAGSNVTIFAASANPGFFVTEAGNLPFANVATYTPGLASLAADSSSFASAIIAGTTQGATFYVPDFARRVRVVLTTLSASGATLIPFTGDPACVLVFYDDRGNVVDEVFQGALAGGAAPVQWNPIPAKAVMLGVYQNPADATLYQAVVNWRIAP